MSRATQTALIQDDRTVYEAAAGTAVGLSGVTFAVGLAAALLGLVAIDAPVAGLELSVVFGALLLALGTSVAGFGAASRFGYVDAAPQPSAGIVAAAAFTGIWFIVGAIVSGAVGLGTGGRLGVGIVLGDRVRDDRAPSRRYRIDGAAGAVAGLCGLSLITGVVGPGWKQVLVGYNATLFGDTVVPLVVLFASLVSGWSAAKAYGGFGARGRNVGAYVLIYLVVCSILAVLIGLVAFVTVKGLPGCSTGSESGVQLSSAGRS